MMIRLFSVLFFLSASLGFAQSGNLLKNAGFGDGLADWVAFGTSTSFVAKAAELQFSVVAGEHNVHLDQNLRLNSRTLYHASIELRTESETLRPGLRIASLDWQTISMQTVDGGGGWRKVSCLFYVEEPDEVRFQIFGAKRALKDLPVGQASHFRNPVLRPAGKAEIQDFASAKITVFPDKPGEKVDSRFFGVNSLFWITDDAARADGKIAGQLKTLGCTLIRFPGGEVADNYHWRTNRLDDIKAFPKEEGPEQMDFDEFMGWLPAIGAEPICVVNLESGFLRGEVEEGVKEAAAWVRYANVEKKYGVKYWEIGNETNLLGTRFPLSAEQYAQAVVRFSRAMKAVDPTIEVGALGPFSPTAVSPLDRLSETELRRVQRLPSGERRRIRKELHFVGEGKAWWPTLCRIAGGDFDFAIIHHYDSSRRDFSKFAVPALKIESQVDELDIFLKQQFGREVPLALTEWNVWRSATKLGALGHSLTIGEQIGNYLSAGVDMANFWPMRYPRGKARDSYFRGLLDCESKEPQAVFRVMELFRRYAKGTVIPVDTGHGDIYGFATRERQAVSVFLINRLGIGEGIEATISCRGMTTASAQVLCAGATKNAVQTMPLAMVCGEGSARLKLLPHSLAVINMVTDSAKR